MLLLVLIVGTVLNLFVSSMALLSALDKPKTDSGRLYLLLIAGVLTANTITFLTLYAVHYGPSN